MPLPLLIPIGIGVAAAITGGGLTLDANGKIKKAKAEHQAAYNAYKAKYEQYQAYHAGTEKRLQELGHARATGMERSARPSISSGKPSWSTPISSATAK